MVGAVVAVAVGAEAEATAAVAARTVIASSLAHNLS